MARREATPPPRLHDGSSQSSSRGAGSGRRKREGDAPVPAEDEAVVGELLERISNDVVHRAALEDRRRAEHAAVHEVRARRVGVRDWDRLVRARQVGEDVGEAEGAAAREDDGLDRVVDGDCERSRAARHQQLPRDKLGEGRDERTVVDDRRHLLAVESRRRVGEGREQDVLDVDADVVGESVVVGVCARVGVSSEPSGPSTRTRTYGSRCAGT